MPWTKEEKAEYMKVYRQDNKERIKIKKKAHNEIWSQTPKGKKSHTISIWKYNGLIGDYDQIYERYINTHKCDVCLKDFLDSYDRCMDHDHDTGIFRQVLCRGCNTNDKWKLHVKFRFE